MSPNTVETPAIADPITQFIAQLQALPSAKRLTDTDTEIIYSIAYNLAAQGHYADALRRLSILMLYRPTNVKYLKGWAVCHQMLGNYDVAIANFAFAASIEPENPEFMLSIAECEIQKQDYQAARESLGVVIRYCKAKGSLGQLLERAEAMHALLTKEVQPA